MNRTIFQPAQVLQDTDLGNMQRNAMIAIGYALQATIGTGTVVDGLACNPTSPPSMAVTVGQGSIIALSEIDATAFGSLALDTNPLVKIGINSEGVTSFTLTAPGTSGQSINYLIEAAFQESDGTPVVEPYYNPSNPADPYSGPNNSGATQNTMRAQIVELQLKAGTAAATGTQTTPTVDSGWVGLYVITVNYGATTVTSGNISTYPNAPFISPKLPGVPAAILAALGGSFPRQFGVLATSTSISSAFDGWCVAITAASTTQTLPAASGNSGMSVGFLANSAFTLATAGGNIYGGALAGVSTVSLNTNDYICLVSDGTNWRIFSASPGVVVPAGTLIKVTNYTTAGTSTFTPQAATKAIEVEGVGAGGSGGGTATTGAGQVSVTSGGSAGAYGRVRFAGISGTYTVVVGAGGAAVINSAGTGGGTTSFTGAGVNLQLPGGPGGGLSITGAAPLNAGGTPSSAPTGADVGATGAVGEFGVGLGAGPPGIGQGGNGASGPWGGGGVGGVNDAGGGSNGPGAGGGGTFGGASAGGNYGGVGHDGLIIVREYS